MADYDSVLHDGATKIFNGPKSLIYFLSRIVSFSLSLWPASLYGCLVRASKIKHARVHKTRNIMPHIFIYPPLL